MDYVICDCAGNTHWYSREEFDVYYANNRIEVRKKGVSLASHVFFNPRYLKTV